MNKNKMQNIKIKTPPIRLSQLLKLSGIVACGADAKALIKAELVCVNGAVALERGKKIYPNDIVAVDNKFFLKVSSDFLEQPLKQENQEKQEKDANDRV